MWRNIMAKRPLYIPTFIKDQNYEPTQTKPRIFYYNGLLDSEPFYVEGYKTGTTDIQTQGYLAIPYIDHYSSGSNVVPDSNSKSLLFFNETNQYGTEPQQNLYSLYWDKYVQFLYNPRTRLVRVRAVIPLAEYFDTNLNDLISFRGNLYQLRAINEYNISDGTCTLELLGPIDQNIFNLPQESVIPTPTTLPPTTTSTTTSTTSTTTTTTSTPTTTTTTTLPAGVYKYYSTRLQRGGFLTDTTACSSTIVSGTPIEIYSNRPNLLQILVGDFLYTEPTLTTPWDGDGEWYGILTTSNLGDQAEVAIQIEDQTGEVIDNIPCGTTTTTTTTASPTTTTTTTAAPTTTTTSTAAPTTTTTSTTTTTTTTPPYQTWYVNDTEGSGYASTVDACTGVATFTVVYTDPAYNNFTNLSPFNTRFYSDSSLTTPFDGAGNYWGIDLSDSTQASDWVAITGNGFLNSKGNC